jgi:hypothetical protein
LAKKKKNQLLLLKIDNDYKKKVSEKWVQSHEEQLDGEEQVKKRVLF